MHCQPKWKKRSEETTKKYHEEFLEKNNTPSNVFIGTSMFERFGYTPEGMKAWEKYGLDKNNIFNCSVGGDRICNILYRLLDLRILDHIKDSPQKTILMCGANDIEKENINIMVDGVKQIITHVKTHFPATKLIVLGMYPRKSDKLSESQVYSRVLEFNSNIKALTDNLNIEYHYFGDDILDTNKEIKTECLVDNVHFSEIGYNLFAKRLSKLLTTVNNREENFKLNSLDFPTLK